jgi:uncharacterized protein
MKKVMNVILVIGAGYLTLVLLLYLVQNSMVFFPDRNVTVNPSAVGLSWEDARFETEDGKTLHGWYIPNEDSDVVFLFSHGNAGNISHRIGFIDLLHDKGISTFIYDYRGYGESEGSPTEKGLYKDIRAAWEYLTGELGYDGSQVILFGRSLGGSVSAHLAQSVNPGGLILESTFTSARDVASNIYPFIPSRIVRFDFATIEYLQNINTPLLIMHSRDDSIIPFHFGEKLYEAAPEPKHFVELRGGHNDNFMVSGELYFDELGRFVSGLER